jgi:hypothetical protein
MALYNVMYEFFVTVEADNEDDAFDFAQESLYDMNMSDWDSVEIQEVE